LTPEELAKALWETWTGNEPDPAWTWERDVDEAHRDDFRAQAARLLLRGDDRRALAAARLEGLLSYLDDRGAVDRAHVARIVTAALHVLREGP
jgi:hypothetical protein